MIRTFDSDRFNEIANHSDVRSHLGGEGVLDFTELCGNVQNYCFLTDNLDGGYLLQYIGDGTYIVHTIALKSARGTPMATLMAEGFKFMFTATDCMEIQTFVPDGNRAAERWTEFAKFKKTFRRENYFLLNGNIVGVQFYNMTYADWVYNSEECKKSGEEFHKFIESKLEHDNHPEDEIHDKFVGAAILCCEANNSGKGILQYNKWAMLAGYQPSKIISLTPLVINIGSAVLQSYNNSMEVLKLL